MIGRAIVFCFAVALIYVFLCFIGILSNNSSNNVLPKHESPVKYDNATHRRLFTDMAGTNEKTDLGAGEQN